MLTVKPLSLPGLLPGLKARLCARVNEDRDKAHSEIFSRAASRFTVRLLLSLLVTMGWAPRTVDVSTAFMLGKPIDRPSPVWVRLPREGGVAPGMVWRLVKCAYGLVDSFPLWYKRVYELMLSIGALRSLADPGLFVMTFDGAVILVVAVHDDGFLYGGTDTGVATFERELQAASSVGPVSSGALVFTGLAVSFAAGCESRPPTAWVHQQAYVDCLDDIPTPVDRLATVGAAVTSSELTLYRRATGALMWAAGQMSPHLACAAAVLARCFQHALVADLVRANKLLDLACTGRRLGLLFRVVPPGQCFYLFTGSSAVTLQSTAAQSGCALLLGESGGPVGPRGSAAARAVCVAAGLVAWGSHRQRSTTHSSYAAEAFSLLQRLLIALDAGAVAGLLFEGAEGVVVPVHAFIDSRALCDSVFSTTATGSKEVRAAVAELRERCQLGTLASVT